MPFGVLSYVQKRKRRKKKNKNSITAGVRCDSSTLQTQNSMQPFPQNVPQKAPKGSKGEVTLKKIKHISRDDNNINNSPPGPQFARTWYRIWKKNTQNNCRSLIFSFCYGFLIQSPGQIRCVCKEIKIKRKNKPSVCLLFIFLEHL